ncbi:MAG: beta-ketoacyl synthase N-terminal-like domain-containing protein [Armatimonadota bacterium]
MADEIRIAITGIGAVSGLGAGVEPLVAALRDGAEPGTDLLEADYDPEDYRESSKTYMDPCSDHALAACYLAVRDAGLGWEAAAHPGFDSQRLGASVGSAFGTLESMLNMSGRVQQKGLRFGSPMIFTHAFMNTPAALIAIEYELQGPNMMHSTGDASSAAALAYALTMMRAGRADLMLVGGCEALTDPLIAAMDAKADGLEARPTNDVDGNDDGRLGASPTDVLGEGAAILVLETQAHAVARGARPLAELTGAASLAPCSDGAGERALIAARSERARVIDAATVCGHTFGASVALSAACCAALAAEAGEPLAAVSADGSGAVVIEGWRE